MSCAAGSGVTLDLTWRRLAGYPRTAWIHHTDLSLSATDACNTAMDRSTWQGDRGAATSQKLGCPSCLPPSSLFPVLSFFLPPFLLISFLPLPSLLSFPSLHSPPFPFPFLGTRPDPKSGVRCLVP